MKMNIMRIRTLVLMGWLAGSWPSGVAVAATAGQAQAEIWRADHRTIDMHQHIDYTTQHLARAIRIMDASGVGIGVNLSGSTVTRAPDGGPSEFERNKQLA